VLAEVRRRAQDVMAERAHSVESPAGLGQDDKLELALLNR
jgi:hypothetical protein